MPTTTIDPTTGEIHEAPATELLPADDAARYAALCDEAAALALDRKRRLEELATEDGDLHFIDRRASEVDAARQEIADRWRAAFERAAPGTAIDSPRVRVLKPRPRVTWRLAKSARALAGAPAKTELERLLTALLDATRDPAAIAESVLAWLRPEARESAPGDLRITVRPPA